MHTEHQEMLLWNAKRLKRCVEYAHLHIHRVEAAASEFLNRSEPIIDFGDLLYELNNATMALNNARTICEQVCTATGQMASPGRSGEEGGYNGQSTYCPAEDKLRRALYALLVHEVRLAHDATDRATDHMAGQESVGPVNLDYVRQQMRRAEDSARKAQSTVEMLGKMLNPST